MTAPVLARNASGRRYVWPPEAPYELVVPSVTNITGNLDKPALKHWAAREAAMWAVDHIVEWENLPPTEAVDLIKKAPFSKARKKADLGTAVHHAIEMMDGATAQDVDPDLLPYVAAASQFLDDHVEKVGIAETTFFNSQYQYAGTPDALVKLKDGRFAIVDWKSGKAIYPETALQLAAYARAEFIGKPDGTRIELDYDINVGVAVHLRDDATYEAHFCDITDRLFGIFRALRNLQLWQDEMKDQVWQQKLSGKANSTQEADN